MYDPESVTMRFNPSSMAFARCQGHTKKLFSPTVSRSLGSKDPWEKTCHASLTPFATIFILWQTLIDALGLPGENYTGPFAWYTKEWTHRESSRGLRTEALTACVMLMGAERLASWLDMARWSLSRKLI